MALIVKKKSLERDKRKSGAIVNITLLLLVFMWTLPTFGILVTSFRMKDNVFKTGWWQSLSDKSGYTMENYAQVMAGGDYKLKNAAGESTQVHGDNMAGAFLNSISVTIPAVVIPILIAAFAAYGFAWLNFPGRKPLFILIVALLVVPLQISLIPVLRDYRQLHLNGTYLGIWLAHTGFGLPLAIYLLFNFISTIPRSILESAFIDGASHFTTFVRLILPLSVPALAAFAIFQFLWVWNDMLVALVFLSGAGAQMQVVTVRLLNLIGSRGQDWQLLTSGAFISMILPLTVFLLLQRYFVRGLMAGSVKE